MFCVCSMWCGVVCVCQRVNSAAAAAIAATADIVVVI